MKSLLYPMILAFAAGAAQAQTAPVQVEGAWARASVAGQKATGAFMKLTAAETLSLVGVDSPVAGLSEVHEMKMEGQVMKMRRMPALELPAGKTVELKPGGYHVMLMDLKEPLKAGSKVQVTLSFRNAKGEASTMRMDVPVATTAPGSTPVPPMPNMPMHKH